MTTFFISGHLDLTQEEFKENYAPKLLEAISNPSSQFIVCDAHGADAMAQLFLKQNDCVDRTTVYHMLEDPRHNVGCFKLLGGFKSDKERDSAATKDSDEDIVWIKPGREKSGTAKNVQRRSKERAKKS